MDRSNDLSFMQEYLFNAMSFEKYIYTWSNALGSTNSLVTQNINRREHEKECLARINNDLSTLEKVYSDGRGEIRSNKVKALVLWPLTILVSALYFYCAHNNYMFFSIPVAIVGIILFFLSVAYSSNWKKYTKDKEKNEKSMLLTQKSRAEENIQQYNEKTELLIDEKDKIEKNLDEVKTVLAEMYTHNVLPECYRNFVAVATMYQYIVTGRCNCVKGHGGIYDTFESDLRLNLIITNLRQINMKLDEISENQRMLCHQMKEANEILSSINKEVKSISEKSEKIERYSAMSALAQQQTLAIVKYNSNISW